MHNFRRAFGGSSCKSTFNPIHVALWTFTNVKISYGDDRDVLGSEEQTWTLSPLRQKPPPGDLAQHHVPRNRVQNLHDAKKADYRNNALTSKGTTLAAKKMVHKAGREIH